MIDEAERQEQLYIKQQMGEYENKTLDDIIEEKRIVPSDQTKKDNPKKEIFKKGVTTKQESSSD
jgi:hypothetical protein